MIFESLFIVSAICLIVSLIVNQLWFYPLLLILLGFFGSEVVVGLGIDTGIRYHNVGTVMNAVFLPILIFGSALQFYREEFWQESIAIIRFTLPLFFFTLLLTATGIYWGIAHPTGFPWSAAFLSAALLTATSPHALPDSFSGRAEYVARLIKGEGLLSGVLAVTLFYFLLHLATHPALTANILSYSILTHIILQFIGVFIVGIVIGGGLAKLVVYLIKIKTVQTALLASALTLLLAYTSYFLASTLFAGAGVLALFTAGLVVADGLKSTSLLPSVKRVWSRLSALSTVGLFILLGVTVTLNMFSARWLAMLIGIIAGLLARMMTVFSLPLTRLFHEKSTSHKIGGLKRGVFDKLLLTCAGIRGEVAIILAFAMPVSLSYWWTVQAIAFGVVIFTVGVQVPFMGLLTRYKHD